MVLQKHHIIYPSEKNKEVVVVLTKAEHYAVTLLNRYTQKQVSSGLIQALEIFIALNKYRAFNPTKEE